MLIGARETTHSGVGEKPYWGLCFTADEGEATISMATYGSAPAVTLETSLNGIVWTPFYVNDTVIKLRGKQKVYFRAGEGGNSALASSTSKYNKFVMTGKVRASGNIQSLLNADGTESVPAYAYTYLFSGCSSLISAPELPGKTVGVWAYRRMFFNCSSLKEAPKELPAKAVSNYAYSAMFEDCVLLTHTPAFLAETFQVESCYSMFKGCSSLLYAHDLLATNLNGSSYSAMFERCSSLVYAPKITEPTSVHTPNGGNPYNRMFYGCSRLKEIRLDWKNPSSIWGGTDWVYGVAKEGKFICPIAYGDDVVIERGTSKCPSNWEVVNPDAPQGEIAPSAAEWGLYIESKKTDSTFNILSVDRDSDTTVLPADIEYSSDEGRTWRHCDLNGGTNFYLRRIGQKVYFRAGKDGTPLVQSTFGAHANSANTSLNCAYRYFNLTGGDFAAGGNPMSLLDGGANAPNNFPAPMSEVIEEAPLYGLFYGQTALTDVTQMEFPDIPLATRCYEAMFYGTGISHPPRLQSMTLAKRCYSAMFYNCSSLVESPELPALTLERNCYGLMFRGCSSLTKAPDTLPALSSVTGCYSSMFYECSSLVKAPEIMCIGSPLAGNFSQMFIFCQNLNYIKVHFDTFPSQGYSRWLDGVALEGTFVCPTALGTNDTIKRGKAYCPEGWTVINED